MGSPPVLKGARISVGVCGGIAAYKVADLVSKLTQAGAEVTVLMTEAATRFVAPLTFAALSGRRVLHSLWDNEPDGSRGHLGPTQNCDLIIVAPATANIIAKLAAGICDDLLSTALCAAGAPVLLAPAMNEQMWKNPITQQNVRRLRRAGFRFVGPERGHLACGVEGVGRMSEPAKIIAAAAGMLASRKRR